MSSIFKFSFKIVGLIMIGKIKRLLEEVPKLKAREIAKRLSFDKTEVNSLLYKATNTFVKNEEHEWSLITKEAIITFPGNWVDCDSFESSLLSAKVDFETASDVKFVLPKDCSFLLDALARFLALCNQLAAEDKNVTVDFIESAKLKHYLNRAGFFDHLNEKVIVLPKRLSSSTAESHKDKSKNLVELGKVTPHEDEAAKDELVKRLTKKFIDLTSDKYKTAISTIFAELAGNIQDHSETKLSGFAGLQKYEGIRPHIQTIISDSGLGIAKTLRPSLKTHHKALYDLYSKANLENDIALVTEVMSKGLISRYGAGRGLGFQTSRDRALKFKAKYSVRQENFSLEFIFENKKLKRVVEKKNLVTILGTHICFDFDID